LVVLGWTGGGDLEGERKGTRWALDVRVAKRSRTMSSGGHRTWAFMPAGEAAGKECGRVPTPKA
jgi:hypothetical protein